MKSDIKGFTLIEIVVVLAVVAILSAIIIPVVAGNIDSARIARCQSDCNTIRDAVLKFKKDTGRWPVYNSGPVDASNPKQNTLYTQQGKQLVNVSPSRTFSYFLVSNSASYPDSDAYRARGLPVWNGPYLSEIKSDPWGNAIFMNSQYLVTSSPAPSPIPAVWIISAGMDRNVQYPFNGSSAPVNSDDIVSKIQ